MHFEVSKRTKTDPFIAICKEECDKLTSLWDEGSNL